MILLKNTIVNFNHVKKRFFTKNGETPVIDDVSFTIGEDEIVALLGPSGAGKTTIFNLLSGLIKPDSGTIDVEASLGYMFQKDNLFEWLSIRKNIAIGLSIQHKMTREKEAKIEELAGRYGLEDFLDNYPSELSGGMRQRVALLRTLTLEPDLLLLDEPFSALDYITRLNLEEDVHRIIKSLGISAMIVTHDISEAIAFADRIYVLTSRPCTIKNIYELELRVPGGEQTPAARRNADNFKDYFHQIAEDLQ